MSQQSRVRVWCVWLAGWAALCACAPHARRVGATAPATPDRPGYTLTADDEALLDDLERRAFRYFEEQAEPATGLVRDRARADGAPHDANHRHVASIAASGFYLAGLCVAAQRGFLPGDEARARARLALRFLHERAPRVQGFFYHWMDARTGARVWDSEVSSIDTALALGGVLAARGCFADDAEITRRAGALYAAVNFRWMLRGRPGLLSHGWRPESGFIAHRWDTYSEHALLTLLAIGAPTHAVSPSVWWRFRRDFVEYGGWRYLAGDSPLFIHQYSHAFVDFRGRREQRAPHVDYFANSLAATYAQRRFCLDQAARFPGWSEDVWGLSASDSARGYVAWGGPPAHPALDGSVVPSAVAGSLMFAPEITLPALRAQRVRFGARVYGRYGFVDAFHPTNGWASPDVVGISAGITLLSAENLRSALVWRAVMASTELRRALDAVGLVAVGPVSHGLARERHSSSLATGGRSRPRPQERNPWRSSTLRFPTPTRRSSPTSPRRPWASTTASITRPTSTTPTN